ncbi:hypothetical protein [Parvibium lacunae]|nr:hypothetical protein [Parvibium lacunae]
MPADWRRLRWPVSMLALTLLLFVGVLLGSREILQESDRQLQQARQARQAADQQLEKVQEEERQIHQSWQRYQALEQSGAFVPFKRAPVADDIEAVISQIRYAAFSYRILQRQLYAGPEVAMLENSHITRHPIEMLGTLAHEESFLSLVAALNERLPERLVWEACELTHQRFRSNELRHGLHLRCTAAMFNWLTPSPQTPNSP